MWWTKAASGFRGWFAVAQSSGALRTGLVAGDFTVTIVDPSGTMTSIPAVAESIKLGLYTFTIPAIFLTGNGVGEYGVSIEVDTFAGPSGPPHVRAVLSHVLRVSLKDLDDITSGAGIADAVWDELLAGHTLAGSAGEALARVDVPVSTRGDLARLILIEKILRNKLITDPVAGTITVYDDDSVTPLITAALYEDVAATQTYRGQGADRRERLT